MFTQLREVFDIMAAISLCRHCALPKLRVLWLSVPGEASHGGIGNLPS